MHKDLDRMLSLLVEEIERVEVTRAGFGKVLSQIKNDIDLGKFPAIATKTVEKPLVTRISSTDLAGLKICGVDGGLVRRRLRSMDLIITRGVAVIFEFGPEEGPMVDFYPDPFPKPTIKPVMLSLPSQEIDQLASLERVTSELKVTLSVLDEFNTDLILTDGSLFYHPRDRPQSGSAAYEKFQEVLALYRQLYSKARKKKTQVIGVIKDSRSTRVVNILGEILPHILHNPSIFEMMQGIDYRWLLKMSRDCDILDTFLDEGERSFAFSYSTELSQNSITLSSDLSNFAHSIWITYLKTARDDLPLRIEVLVKDSENGVRELNRALSAILPLSWQHPEYGIPSPILEADTRARIKSNEIRLIIDRLMALSGLTYASLEKRSSRNPFGGG